MDYNKNINNIDDGFLRRLIKLTAEEPVPDGFVKKIMQQLPASEQQPMLAEPSRRWIWIVAVAAVAVAIVVAIPFSTGDFFARFASADGFQIYRQLFGSVVGSFSKGFSAIHISSIGFLILISTLLLYLLNLLLRRWFDQNPSAAQPCR
ncbi:MAG: hypothetical protein RBR47_03470 [Bacteroidales bacterium]|jgi:hypothetical protein|nr:hypothetical protein [Bacteroidales bacterium]NCU37243.1 hypothetical protein [Candidatus Falkowbacteria bacterium]MDD2631277.1 hypothetical protein [Bacteroidales bacterium]MDD3130235.1 hypothetical protein [Bacteroidales bacterium]MDD3527717.1 hypothetical protein [Bacteroidales bacterium]